MKLRDQIDALIKQRKAELDALQALSDKAAGNGEGEQGRLFTVDEQKEFDKIKANIADIDQTLSRLEEAERQLAAGARPAPHPLNPTPGAEVRAFKPFPGQVFTRYCMALAASKGNLMQALEIAKRWHNETPEVVDVLRAAVAAGTTTDPTWAAPLVNYTVMTSEFIDLLRPETIFGRLVGYRTVPFNVKIPRQTAGATANWVGEGLSKPVSALAFDTVTVPWAKIAVIVVITQELARFSSPSAEMLVRDDLIAAIAQFLDQQLLDPAVAPVAALKPGSITNGVVAIPAGPGTVAGITADLSTAMLNMVNALNSIGRPVWLMSPTAAMYLATLRTAQDIFAFLGMGVGQATAANAAQGNTGQSLMGIPVITSGNIPVAAGKSNIVLLDQSQLMVADDGQVVIDTSTEAALQLDTAPATPPTPLVSLWQQNMLGIKAERFIYWLMRRTAGVQVITGFPGAVAPP